MNRKPISPTAVDVLSGVWEAWEYRLRPISDGSGHGKGPDASDGWIHGLRMFDLSDTPLIRPPVPGLVPARTMLNELAPGAMLKRHRDGLPHDVFRFHYPLGPGVGEWWDEWNGTVEMSPGFVYGPVPYYFLHSMANRSSEPRRHVVIDWKAGWL